MNYHHLIRRAFFEKSLSLWHDRQTQEILAVSMMKLRSDAFSLRYLRS
jgi:hypothetical protein